jgi:hypothetical protein
MEVRVRQENVLFIHLLKLQHILLIFYSALITGNLPFDYKRYIGEIRSWCCQLETFVMVVGILQTIFYILGGEDLREN